MNNRISEFLSIPQRHSMLWGLIGFLVILAVTTSVIIETMDRVSIEYETQCATLCLNTTNTMVRTTNGTECWCMDGKPALNGTLSMCEHPPCVPIPQDQVLPSAVWTILGAIIMVPVFLGLASQIEKWGNAHD